MTSSRVLPSRHYDASGSASIPQNFRHDFQRTLSTLIVDSSARREIIYHSSPMSFAGKLSAAPGPGFLGLTSSCVEYVGAQKQHGIIDTEDNEDENLINTSLENGDLPDYLEDQIDAGAAVLSHLQDFLLFESLVCEWRLQIFGSNVFFTWINYVSNSIKELLYEPMHPLTQAGNRSLPHNLSRWLFRNSLHPFRFDGHCTVKQFAALFTGESLRWQAVGIFFTAASIATITRVDTSPALLSIGGMDSRRRSVLARRLLEVGQTCLNFCDKIGHVTDPEIWLAFEIAHVSSVVEGDAGKAPNALNVLSEH